MQKQVGKLISTKAECWSYEDEWRVLARLRDLKQVEGKDTFLMPFPAEAITRVVVGFKAGPGELDAVRECVRATLGTEVAVQQAELDKGRYAVVVPQLTDGTANKPSAGCSVQPGTNDPSSSGTEG
jgi:hypothetical protein